MEANGLPSKVQEIFSEILGLQDKNHSDQISLLLQLSNINCEITKDLLSYFQRLFWCIDDTIDNAYSKEDIYKNEVAKLTIIYSIFATLLKLQKKEKLDAIGSIIGYQSISEKIMNIFLRNLEKLSMIPPNERLSYEKIKNSKTIDEIAENVLNCLLYRTIVLNFYLDVIELLGGKITKE